MIFKQQMIKQGGNYSHKSKTQSIDFSFIFFHRRPGGQQAFGFPLKPIHSKLSVGLIYY